MAWRAAPMILQGEEGYIHVHCVVTGDTPGDAKTGAGWILETMAAGKKAFIRQKPYAFTEEEFDSSRVIHRAIVRFSMSEEPGEWVHREEPDRNGVLVVGFGGVNEPG